MAESKKEIYEIIPQKYYPKTNLVLEKSNFENVLSEIEKSQIKLPFIAKPDIGLRGTAVKKIHSVVELKSYVEKSNFDYLIQDLIPYENEIGLFYVKLPDSEKGILTGIVSKEFLILKGNGTNTIRELLKKDPRFELQIPVLEIEFSEIIDTILEEHKSLNLVPYGNHCRGTKFVDVSHKITPKMIDSFNAICSKIEGFHFGRMDIMYTNFADLENGKNFQIVEINGAISEPTHMYDPKHSLLYGWKELIRHFHYMYLISKENNKNGTKYLTFKEGVEEFKNHHKHYDKILEF